MGEGLNEAFEGPGAGAVTGGPEAMGPDAARDRSGRALVAPQVVPDRRTGPSAKPLAVFLTQLLACRDGDPAYRSRRRAEPDFASAAYAAEGEAFARGRFERVL